MRELKGWALMPGPTGGRKYHYFNNDIASLCGLWLNMSTDPVKTQEGSPEPLITCPECRAKKLNIDQKS